jgi:hypothetical protein
MLNACSRYPALILGLLMVDPRKRMTMEQIWEHHWIMSYVQTVDDIRRYLISPAHRPSQFANKGSITLAERLTKNLREAGDMDVANPL